MSLTYGFCLGGENSETTSSEFSLALYSAFGSGVCSYGNKLPVSAPGGMNLSVGTGFAMVQGRWFKSDDVETLSLQPANNNFDRYDAVVIRANIPEKSLSLEVVQGKASAFPSPYVPTRNGDLYEIVLCSVLVRMGTTQILPEDLTDTRGDSSLCGIISPLSEVANQIIYVDQFLKSGIDQEVDRLEKLAESIMDKANDTIESIEQIMNKANVSSRVGDVKTLLGDPTSSSWLLCDGSSVPSSYPELMKLLSDGKLPNIQWTDSKFKSYIYAGTPTN